MKNENAAISVIMSVYNTETEYLNLAIQSILDQTFQDFEFIIIDDGSNEECVKALKKFKDERIQLITNPKNYGLTKSLNIGLRKARGRYIARMDADDYSYPERLKQQYQYMEKHKEIHILGTWVKEGKKIQKCCGNVPTKWRYTRMLFDNVGIFHPTAFIRADFLKENYLFYDEGFKKAQDFELWSRCLKIGRMYVLPQVLLDYRIHDGQISTRGRGEQDYYNICTREKMLSQLDIDLNEREKQQFAKINECCMTAPEAEALFDKIVNANRQKRIFDQRMLKNELGTKWLRYLFSAKGTDRRSWMQGKYAKVIYSAKYYLYMLFIAWCKQDFFHHNREKR